MPDTSRREFLHRLGKTAYITPVVLTLPVTPALAGSGSLQSTRGSSTTGGVNTGNPGNGSSGSPVGGSQPGDPGPLPEPIANSNDYSGGRLSPDVWFESRDWPVDQLEIGGKLLDRAALQDILGRDSTGDPDLALMQELIALKLNAANGQLLVNLKPWVESADAYLAGQKFLSAGELERTLQALHWYNTNVVGY